MKTLERLQAIEENLHNLVMEVRVQNQQNSYQQETLKEVSDNVHQLSIMLNGNGSMGLVSKVSVLWKVGWGIASSAGVLVAAWVFNKITG